MTTTYFTKLNEKKKKKKPCKSVCWGKKKELFAEQKKRNRRAERETHGECKAPPWFSTHELVCKRGRLSAHPCKRPLQVCSCCCASNSNIINTTLPRKAGAVITNFVTNEFASSGSWQRNTNCAHFQIGTSFSARHVLIKLLPCIHWFLTGELCDVAKNALKSG